MKVSGGLELETKLGNEDSCGGGLSPEGALSLSYIVDPGQIFGVTADGVTRGQVGDITASLVSVLKTGAIWSTMEGCTLHIESATEVNATLDKVTGSLTCAAALTGVGSPVPDPLTIERWSFISAVNITN